MTPNKQLSLFDNPDFFKAVVNNSKISIEIASILCIQNTLNFLYKEQQEDVEKAEKRFFVDNGKGILFSNSTGTGKTYTGLGIAKRFVLRGLNNVLIIVPSDQKAKDWIKDAENLDLEVKQLVNITDKGEGINVTSYANFYQNNAILTREFDLIIYDESHYLSQAQNGKLTEYYWQHVKIANLPSTAKEKAIKQLREKPQSPDSPFRPYSYESNYEEKYALYEKLYDQYCKDYDVYRDNLDKWNEDFNKLSQEIVDKTKVVFLSATPFAYHKSLMYGDGTLFEISEKLEENEVSYGYNEASGFDAMLTENFGYRMRHNRPNCPESGVDTNLLERNFFETMVEKGIFSGRQLEVDMDYSRDFILLDQDELSLRINEGMKLFRNFDNKDFREKYKNLSMVVGKKWNFLYINQLLESIKINSVIPRIKQHLELGRKVVVFHGYNNGSPAHPFHFNAFSLCNAEERRSGFVHVVQKEIELFEQEYPELVNMDLSELDNVRATLKRELDNTREFNGTVAKKRRFKNIQNFNKKGSGVDVIAIQRKAGKEGISLHDVMGDCQRVLVDVGLPTAPSDAIQTEGRIYRLGVKNNAIFEYPVLHTDFERIAFAEKVASRARTAENFAMGNLARNLEDAFINGYKDAFSDEPSLLQGVGGKENDQNVIKNNISEYEKAITYYFARGAKTARNKSKEGIDYFATAEPIGYKMHEWLDLKPNDDAMEPSAGHGAIARFFGEETNNTFVEPSFTLMSQLKLNAKGNVKQIRFEDLHIINKFDGIAMNPPFGTAGKMAMKHVEKAYGHLRNNGRVVAIVPNSPSMDKRLNAFFGKTDEEGDLVYPGATMVMEVILPSVAFKRAGTTIGTKIIVIDKLHCEYNESMKIIIDLSHCDNPQSLFKELEHISSPNRLGQSYKYAC